MGELIRTAFVPRKGRRLVERDLSGVEVRVSACYNKDPKLIEYIKDPTTDMHRDTAMDLFMLTKEQVFKKTTRDCAKNQFVFPQFYGSVYFQCAPAIWESMLKRDFRIGESGKPVIKHLRENGIKELGDCDPDRIKQHGTKLGTFVHHCKTVERRMWQDRFAVYTEWKNEWYDLYQKRGWFPLYTGFVCQGLYRRNQVLNFSIQGSAFHCLLWGVIRLSEMFARRKMRSLIVGQIHDCVIFDAVESELQDVLELSDRVFSRDLPRAWPWIIVPMETEVDVTPRDASWHQKQEWKKIGGTWRLAS